MHSTLEFPLKHFDEFNLNQFHLKSQDYSITVHLISRFWFPHLKAQLTDDAGAGTVHQRILTAAGSRIQQQKSCSAALGGSTP